MLRGHARAAVRGQRAEQVGLLQVRVHHVDLQPADHAQQMRCGPRRHEVLPGHAHVLDRAGRLLQPVAEPAAAEQHQRARAAAVRQHHAVAEEEAAEEQHRLQVMSGTTPVSGPGVTITIHDPRDKVTSDLLLNAVEELRDAGAEAIAVNSDIRVVANTWFGRDANGLVVSGKKVKRPMTLTVLGEPHALTEGAKFRGGLVSQVESAQVGGSVSITPSDSLTISAVVKPTPMSFATPVR